MQMMLVELTHKNLAEHNGQFALRTCQQEDGSAQQEEDSQCLCVKHSRESDFLNYCRWGWIDRVDKLLEEDLSESLPIPQKLSIAIRSEDKKLLQVLLKHTTELYLQWVNTYGKSAAHLNFRIWLREVLDEDGIEYSDLNSEARHVLGTTFSYNESSTEEHETSLRYLEEI